MKIRIMTAFGAIVLLATGAVADEIHNKAATVENDLKEAISLMHVIGNEHGPDFDGHFAKAENLAREADQERALGMKYYREHHPGWQ